MYTITVNERLKLKILNPDEDVEESFAVLQQNMPHLEVFIPWMKHRTLENDKKIMLEALDKFSNGLGLEMGIFEKEVANEGENKNLWRFIGWCGIIRVNKENPQDAFAELGYWLDKDHWGQGIISKCSPKLIEFAFTDLKLDKLKLVTDNRNEKSLSVAGRLKFKLTDEKVTDQMCPEEDLSKLVVYALNKSDWLLSQ
ncbi:putative ribosomal N-acetyltransferase YdaF isoform X1 [Styela clava]